jgi:hypothetical protein
MVKRKYNLKSKIPNEKLPNHLVIQIPIKGISKVSPISRIFGVFKNVYTIKIPFTYKWP